MSDDLCHAIALMTRQLCIDELKDPKSISAVSACRSIPLDKCPGLRPIGIGEVLRRIMGKAVMQILKEDILNVTGYDQLCSGLEAGCEAGVHAVNDLFNEADTHGFIQVDATNAFNTINRKVLLHNSKILCPKIACYLENVYIMPARLFIVGGKEITSEEGTTQGDAVAMGMYSLGLMPLLMTIETYMDKDTIKQIAFADDLTGIGKVQELQKWWNTIITNGPYIGYHVNQQKSWLVVKPEYFDEAKRLFHNYDIRITSDGRRHLGAAVGNTDFVKSYVNEKLSSWTDGLNRLSYIAQTQPHAARVHRLHPWLKT